MPQQKKKSPATKKKTTKKKKTTPKCKCNQIKEGGFILPLLAGLAGSMLLPKLFGRGLTLPGTRPPR